MRYNRVYILRAYCFYDGYSLVQTLVYIVKRLLSALPTLLLVSVLGFVLMRFNITLGPISMPGVWVGKPALATVRLMEAVVLKNPINPLAALKNNPQISAAALAQETKRLGLAQPMWEQYSRWLQGLFTLHWPTNGQLVPQWQPNLGKTFTGEPVTSVLFNRAGNTILLNSITLLITWLLALPLGVWAALRQKSAVDRGMTLVSAMGMALPGFVLALMLSVVAVQTGWLPLGGLVSDGFEAMALPQQVWDITSHLILPVLVLTVGGLAGLQRQMRGNLLEVLGADYVRTARAKGLPEWLVIYKHALRTAINPMITLLGFEFAGLLGGSVLVEAVLGYPGLGQLAYQAVLQTDTNLVMAILILSASMLILGNLLADVLLGWVDPRVTL
jgi:peptide/nickel transport system permease protein